MSTRWVWSLCACGLLWATAVGAEEAAVEELRSLRVELAGQEGNVVRTSWPSIGCWFWTGEEFKPDGYKRFLDLHAKHSPYQLLTTSIRHPVEVTQGAVHDQIQRACAYARQHGMEIVMDLDVRLARQAFQDKHPEQMQEIVRVREAALKGAGAIELALPPMSLGDHYTFRARPYECIGGRLVRAYSYATKGGAVAGDSVRDITGRCRIVQADARGVTIALDCGPADEGRTACVLAAFTLFTPDVYAPDLIAFERAILRQYADAGLAGACKDEWGFPGRFRPGADDLWFSPAMAQAYAKRRPGRDLVRDLLLMARPHAGQEGERAAAVNHYMEMNRLRNAEVENAFYDGVKAVLGPQAMAATHPTWYPFPTSEEAYKNGLDWWACRRDLAQTDEGTPVAARTALAKKWASPLWYNMFYHSRIETYREELWRSALGGGRINYHPLYPRAMEDLTTGLLAGDLLAAECRVRLLNFISTAPIDCPVAVVFGHPSALNWTGGGFADVGMDVINRLWAEGFYADLIPSSEVACGALRVDEQGHLAYGKQRYAAAVLYRLQGERAATAEPFARAAKAGKTRVWRVGEWRADFEGQALDGPAALGAEVAEAASPAAAAESVMDHLRKAGVAPQTRCTMRGTGFPASMMPLPSGQCRLLDGTVVAASGAKDVMGDPIRATLTARGREAVFEAAGLAAVRLDEGGQVEAMAAGALRSFRCGQMDIRLEPPLDVAMWRDAAGRWHGAVQGLRGPLPQPLAAMTKDWVRLRLPTPYLP